MLQNDELISVAAIGNVAKKSTFSGIPFHFYHTLLAKGCQAEPWQMDTEKLKIKRIVWNLCKSLGGQQPGGFQYSRQFAQSLIKQIPDRLLTGKVVSFNQHFPTFSQVKEKNGKLYPYIDATFRQLLERYGVSKQIGRKIRDSALAAEEEYFHSVPRIFTFQQWAKDSLIHDYGVEEHKVKVVLPGANLIFEPSYHANIKKEVESLGKSNPLILGFVGKDWKRKGLLVLADVRDELERRGWNVTIRCVGNAPSDFARRKGVEFVGFIEKETRQREFINFLESCDIGCLFSEAEFSSISVLEFISVGRPVAGFVVDGMGDLFLPDLSITFNPSDSIKLIADGFDKYLQDTSYRRSMNTNAVLSCNYVRWSRAVDELVTEL
jgi:glycosyltransferase involved in cell wall biosynthesis